MTVHLSTALEEELKHLASQSNSTADDLAQQALEEFVAFRRDLSEAVRQGDEDFEAGELFEQQEVFARMDHLVGRRQTFSAVVHDGIAAGERGELVEHEEVVAMLDAIIVHG